LKSGDLVIARDRVICELFGFRLIRDHPRQPAFQYQLNAISAIVDPPITRSRTITRLYERLLVRVPTPLRLLAG
jgi:hypothetical protein